MQEQYNGRRIPYVAFVIFMSKEFCRYQYKAIAEIWKVYGESISRTNRNHVGNLKVKVKKCISMVAKPLYEVPIELRKGTDLEDMTNEEDVINVVPFTDYASILYLNDDFEGGETFFEDGTVLKPKQGTCVIFQSMKHFHGVYPTTW